MSDDQPSLIQQRIAIDRQRVIGKLVVLVAAVLLALGGVLMIYTPEAGFRWASLLWALWLLIGIVQVLQADRRRKQFEAEHGRDAGRQKPVSR